MTFEEAVRKAMRAYYTEVTLPEKGPKKKMKYTKKYFNSVGKEYGIEEVDLKKGRKGY